MTTTRDVSTAERPTTPQPRPTSEPATPWRGGEFHAALQQAAERHAPLARQPSRAEREDEDRTEDGADLAALFGPAHDFKGADAATTDKAPVDGVGTPGAAAHGAAEPVVIQLPAGATSAEIEAFAAAMEKAWLAAGGNASKGVAMGLADRGLFVMVERRRPVCGRILNAGGLRPPRARRFADPSIPSAFQLPSATVCANALAALLDGGFRTGACRPAPRPHADERRP